MANEARREHRKGNSARSPREDAVFKKALTAVALTAELVACAPTSPAVPAAQGGGPGEDRPTHSSSIAPSTFLIPGTDQPVTDQSAVIAGGAFRFTDAHVAASSAQTLPR
jgi:hypothetical protein